MSRMIPELVESLRKAKQIRSERTYSRMVFPEPALTRRTRQNPLYRKHGDVRTFTMDPQQCTLLTPLREDAALKEP